MSTGKQESLRTSDFDYHLPEELIASRPPERREASRMMVVDRTFGTIEHRKFADFPNHLVAEDLVVMNDTRVLPARFFSNDHRIELLRLDNADPLVWKCLVKPGKRMKLGRTVEIGDATGEVIEILEKGGERIVRFDQPVDVEAHGHLALPHYMGRDDEATDFERYQTVYAREEGAIAAPTAGLHFTPEMVDRIPHAFVTLHVGVGTFRPVNVEDLTGHIMHSENYTISEENASAIKNASRTVAVGTTVVRVLEHCMRSHGEIIPHAGETDIFIYPPYQFRKVDALLTNFHLPKSTLLMLISAFAGRELILQAYEKAIADRYRFYSYGDCMLIK